MNFIDGDTVLKMFAASLKGVAGDWLFFLCRRADGSLAGEYRFRYHAGPSLDDDDKISRYTMTSKDGSPTHAEEVCQAVRKMLAAGPFENIIERDINGGVDKLKEALLSMPGWATRMSMEQVRR